ncbi:uncharacterized protein LOC121389820 [Gigantopelta aegis]|uniref:uncharacterized protein LOC121389820 n=1 Tax=Gigantopelta aegis TaxID=1735272 RepID=UPI001B889043|nr:uncharacterized protein LOC121389820 [Gigantopelta aegis]
MTDTTTTKYHFTLLAPPGGLPLSQDWLERMTLVRDRTIQIIFATSKRYYDTIYIHIRLPVLLYFRNIHEQNINSSVDIDSSAVDFEIKQKDGTPVSSSAAVSLDDQLTFEFVGKQTCSYRYYPRKSRQSKPSAVLADTDLDTCRAACSSDPTCVSFQFYVLAKNDVVQCTKFKKPADLLIDFYTDHYEKNCTIGSNPCSYVEYPDKEGPRGEQIVDVQDLTECKAKCDTDSNCTSFDFHVADIFVKCHLYTKPVVDGLFDCKMHYYTSECSAFRVESCTASNGQTGQDQDTLKLIDHSCPSGEVGKLMEQAPTKVNDTTVTFKLHPFKFNKVNAITVTCTVKVCPAGTAAECEALNCSSQPNRKRRSTEISDETVRKTFIILDPNLQLTRPHDSSKESSVSVDDVTTPIVAGVAMVIILLLAISIVVLLVVKKKRIQREVSGRWCEQANHLITNQRNEKHV